MHSVDPQAGTSVADKLKAQIAESHIVIVLLTKAAELRPSIHTEIGIALTLKKRIIPIVEDGVDFSQFVFLQGLEFIKLNRADTQGAFLALQHSLKKAQEFAVSHKSDIALALAIAALILAALALAKD